MSYRGIERVWWMERAVSNMQEVPHRRHMYYSGNGFWEDDGKEKKEKKEKKRSLDDLDTAELSKMHDLKRACNKFHREFEDATVDSEGGAYDREVAVFKETQEEEGVWHLFKLTQLVNKDHDTCHEALVVATDEDTAKQIHPRNQPRGWWAEKNYSQNAIEWNLYHTGKPMPMWFLANACDWVHPSFVTATRVCSFDGKQEERNTCIFSS